MIYSIKYTVNKLLLDTRIVHPDTLNCYNYLWKVKLRSEYMESFDIVKIAVKAADSKRAKISRL